MLTAGSGLQIVARHLQAFARETSRETVPASGGLRFGRIFGLYDGI